MFRKKEAKQEYEYKLDPIFDYSDFCHKNNIGLAISFFVSLIYVGGVVSIVHEGWKLHHNDDQNTIAIEDTIQEIDNEIIEIKTNNEELSTFINNAPENYEIYEIIQDDNSNEVIIRYIKNREIKNQSNNKTLKMIMPS